jgi:hypothetical protein
MLARSGLHFRFWLILCGLEADRASSRIPLKMLVLKAPGFNTEAPHRSLFGKLPPG